jgi:uncharacterized membrane protein
VEKPNRILAFLSYLLVLIGPLIVLLFRRKDRFSLYHACQSLALLGVAIVVPVGWLVIGWLFTWMSVTAPILYLLPIGIALLLPVLARRRKAVRYAEGWSWFTVGISLLTAGALIYGCWLVLRWLAPLILPLFGQLMLMSSFSVVMAAMIAVVVAWVAGMLHALQAQSKAVPIFGGWGDRLYARLAPDA